MIDELPYCVYLTVYLGNKLPSYYIGSGQVKKIKQGYKGSANSKEYGAICDEEKKNSPHLFKVHPICFFKTREEAYIKEDKLQRALKVVESPLYVNKTYAKDRRVKRIDHPLKGRKHSEKRKLNISNGMRGNSNAKGKFNFECPHCLKSSKSPVIFRHHFDRCKSKTRGTFDTHQVAH